MSDTKGHTIQVVNGPAGPSLYLDDYRIAGPKPWGGGTVLHEFAFKDKDLIAAGVALAATPAPLDDYVRVIDVDAWLPQHTGYCANQPEDECSCGVGPEYERMLATAYAATPAPLDVDCGDPFHKTAECPTCGLPDTGYDRGYRDALATPAPLDVALPPGDPTLMSGYKPAKRTAATSVTPAPNGHQTPGEYHDYRVACAKCGEPGFLHVSWRPEKFEAPK